MSKIEELFKSEIKVINIGLESFYQDLKKQEVSVIHVNWRPIAGGNKRIAALLSRLK